MSMFRNEPSQEAAQQERKAANSDLKTRGISDTATLNRGTQTHHGVTRDDWDGWWREAVIYQVYPRSFADANEDGMGDLPGVIEKLDYLAALGVDAIWLSPFYPSPQKDAGYDVSDYCDINPTFGTLEDFDLLVAGAHALGIKIMCDIVPNHTSDQHEWFQAALAAGPGSAERERYIFRYQPEGTPNNWGSIFGGPAWEPVFPHTGNPVDEGWYYLHLFDVTQPDLNWDNPEVPAYFDRVLKFWCDRGVDGFRIDVAHGMVKAPGLPDDEIGPDRYADAGEDGSGAALSEQLSANEHPENSGPASGVPDSEAASPTASDSETATPTAPGALATPPGGSNIAPYFDQPGVHQIFKRWHKLLAGYAGNKCAVAEAWVEPAERFAAYTAPGELHQAFNFAFLAAGWDAPALRAAMTASSQANDRVGAPTTWVLSNHDVVRHATRFAYQADCGFDPAGGIGVDNPQPDTGLGLARARALSLFMLGLPGASYIYQGEELGLPEHTTLPDEARQDPTWYRSNYRARGRDGARVPLPWQPEGPSYGFTITGADCQPWLPQPEYWGEYAASAQEKDQNSTLNLYRQALKVRKTHHLGRVAAGQPGIQWVDQDQKLGERWVLAVQNGDVQVLINMGENLLPTGDLFAALDASGAEEVLVASDQVQPREDLGKYLESHGGGLPPTTAIWIKNPAKPNVEEPQTHE
ncbi:hypothetical protein BSR28_01755 [Boudabousia liubingyangii]|uniref:glycoside hydrolase family 13 protein n=1 Tax=Boudabousia liubingyangii TaxID=1921764 RepID=UPI00093A84B8|nr:glycoside hydrolase family 13 protein [Boudabousia liubingyangii]OKL48453.1 hypothetical protein BSR28_01755 [Boudabousia liubingyangii]